MAETKPDPTVIVTARYYAATICKRPNGKLDYAEADRIYDWIMAPVLADAGGRLAEQQARMAKARAAKKRGTDQEEADKARRETEVSMRRERDERARAELMARHPANG